MEASSRALISTPMIESGDSLDLVELRTKYLLIFWSVPDQREYPIFSTSVRKGTYFHLDLRTVETNVTRDSTYPR